MYQGVRPTSGSLVILVMHAEHLIERGCKAYFATISLSEAVEEARVQEFREFQDVFLLLQGLPPSRSDPFTIELESGTAPISRAPYRMVPVEMAELKKQLAELLSKGFIA